MRPILSLLLIFVAGFSSSAQTDPAQTLGSLCILAHPAKADMRTGSAEMPPPAEKYTLQLDGGRWVELSTKTSVWLTDIPRVGRHKVAIRGDGRPWAAFTFTFDPTERNLCLYQNNFYGWWQLAAPQQSFRACHCKGVAPTTWTLTPGISVPAPRPEMRRRLRSID
jgi:hypothetical protein